MRFSADALFHWKRAFRFSQFWFSSGAALLLLIVAGCMRNEPRADIVIVNAAEPESLDPAILTGQPDGRIAEVLFEGLTRFDPKDALPIPGLAERWDISTDGSVYTFYLRSN